MKNSLLIRTEPWYITFTSSKNRGKSRTIFILSADFQGDVDDCLMLELSIGRLSRDYLDSFSWMHGKISVQFQMFPL